MAKTATTTAMKPAIFTVMESSLGAQPCRDGFRLFLLVSIEFLYHDSPKQSKPRGTHAPYLLLDWDGADCIQSDSRRLEGISTARTRFPCGISRRSGGLHRALPYGSRSIGDRSHLFLQRR